MTLLSADRANPADSEVRLSRKARDHPPEPLPIACGNRGPDLATTAGLGPDAGAPQVHAISHLMIAEPEVEATSSAVSLTRPMCRPRRLRDPHGCSALRPSPDRSCLPCSGRWTLRQAKGLPSFWVRNCLVPLKIRGIRRLSSLGGIGVLFVRTFVRLAAIAMPMRSFVGFLDLGFAHFRPPSVLCRPHQVTFATVGKSFVN